ncbi:MAG TPA: hypothetical protein VH253_00110 [Phycisphaerae bacterium]|nr:hypothetical protein [Phycisphaerae bacterium]
MSVNTLPTEALAPMAPMWAEPAAAAAPAETNPLMVVHRIMRGRYWLAILLAMIVGGGLAYYGFRRGQVLYTSTAMVRFRAVMPAILYHNDQNGMMPMFDSFVDSQVLLMRSQRVTDLAMQSEDWRALHRPNTPEAAADFVKSLNVWRDERGGEMVQVSFTDKDPNAAMIAARAVIEAYQNLYGDSDFGEDSHRMQTLEDRKTGLSNEIRGFNQQIQAIANEFGSDDLEETYQYKISQLNNVETALNEVHLKITSMSDSPATAPAASEPAPGAAAAGAASQPVTVTRPAAAVAAAATQPVKLTPEDIGKQDKTMAAKLQARDEKQHEIDIMLIDKKPDHPDVKHARAVLAQINKDIEKYAVAWSPPDAVMSADGKPVTQMSELDELKGREARLRRLYEDNKADVINMGRKALQIKSLRQQADEDRSKLVETQNRIDQLNLESTGTGRISVVSTGDRPGLPSRDTRKSYAAAGGVGGTLFGIAIVAMLGLLDRRLKTSHDAKTKGMHGMEMLGVLPHLTGNSVDQETAALAAHCVHGVRASLQVAAGGNKMTYAITSPAASEGKTSLVLALGMSFAATGARTLLIDCDLIGGGMSHRVKGMAKTSVMTALLAQNRVDKHKLKEAAQRAQATSRSLEDVLVDMNLMTHEEIQESMEAWNARPQGLMDVIGGASLLGAVQCMGERRLSVLTLASAGPEDVHRLSPKKLSRLLESAKKHYDVVLVDTGPVLGSLEAVMVSGLVDSVLMVVSRGTRREMAARAIDRLEAAGGRPSGVVFNRADSRDATYASSSSHGSVTSRRSSSDAVIARRTSTGMERYERMGALVAAVAACTRREEVEAA